MKIFLKNALSIFSPNMFLLKNVLTPMFFDQKYFNTIHYFDVDLQIDIVLVGYHLLNKTVNCPYPHLQKINQLRES